MSICQIFALRGTRTLTPKHWFLKPACLPIPPEELFFSQAEREGFEPSVALATTVFKTVAIVHSATFPIWSG